MIVMQALDNMTGAVGDWYCVKTRQEFRDLMKDVKSLIRERGCRLEKMAKTDMSARYVLIDRRGKNHWYVYPFRVADRLIAAEND